MTKRDKGSASISPQEVRRLNEAFAKAHPTQIIRWALETFSPDVALTSSFGAESACLIHLAIQVDPSISIRMVDTGFIFDETLQFMEQLKTRFGLNVSVFRTKMDVEKFKQEHAHLPPGHPDFCCGEYKVEATERALSGLRCWLTGIRRSQAPTRAQTQHVEVLSGGLVKLAPIAAWTPRDIHAYMTAHDLPYHPLWQKGYTSIGCWPCTRKPTDPDEPRSGRWAGQDKTECGIHMIGKTEPQRPKKKDA
jgi:phosphoadenosine phosphosulfate reductase